MGDFNENLTKNDLLFVFEWEKKKTDLKKRFRWFNIQVGFFWRTLQISRTNTTDEKIHCLVSISAKCDTSTPFFFFFFFARLTFERPLQNTTNSIAWIILGKQKWGRCCWKEAALVTIRSCCWIVCQFIEASPLNERSCYNDCFSFIWL